MKKKILCDFIEKLYESNLKDSLPDKTNLNKLIFSISLS